MTRKTCGNRRCHRRVGAKLARGAGLLRVARAATPCRRSTAMMIALAAIPDIAVDQGGLSVSSQWLVLALAAGFFGLLARRALAAKRTAKREAADGDKATGS
jgi:hypothetical protein